MVIISMTKLKETVLLLMLYPNFLPPLLRVNQCSKVRQQVLISEGRDVVVCITSLWFMSSPQSLRFLDLPIFSSEKHSTENSHFMILEWCCNHSFRTFKHLRVKSRANIGKSCLLRGSADVVSAIEVLKVRFGEISHPLLISTWKINKSFKSKV